MAAAKTSMNYSGYFLIVSDFIRWSKANGIPVGPGRGSGAGSIVACVLQITDLDPTKFGKGCAMRCWKGITDALCSGRLCGIENAVFVLKRELKWIPFVGLHLVVLGMIFINRLDGISSIRHIVKLVQNYLRMAFLHSSNDTETKHNDCFQYFKYFNILAIAILSHSSYRNCAPSTSSQALFLSSTLSAMSLTTKKRFVMKQAESELFLPKGNEIIARVLRSPGRNLHEVDDEKGEKYLVSMPRKFRETIYIKRGSFVFVVPIKEGVKVKAEITQILDNENVLYIRDQKMWPKRFEIYAESITREAKRGTVASGTKKHDVIDEDMLPPSDTNDGDYDENDEDDKKRMATIRRAI
ncbi:DNA-directed DNA polymerase [Dirofilaria immitis]|nr:DNA-directed DNA polymerase [Dirofilaria immitis]